MGQRSPPIGPPFEHSDLNEFLLVHPYSDFRVFLLVTSLSFRWFAHIYRDLNETPLVYTSSTYIVTNRNPLVQPPGDPDFPLVRL